MQHKENSAKCNLNAINERRQKRDSKELSEKTQMPLPNIPLNKGKYPKSGEEPLHFSTICDISHISQDFANNPKQ